MNYSDDALITIGGVKYIPRKQTFPAEVTVSVANSIQSQLRLVIPGTYNFILKGLMRDTVAAGASVSRRFKFKFGNTDGATWYSQGGVGGTTDRVLDNLIFGNAQFPGVVIPGIYYDKNAAIMYEVEDISATVPYTIYLGFEGIYLIPV